MPFSFATKCMQIAFLLIWSLLLVLVALFVVLVVRALRGDFWPGRLLRLFREGRQSVQSDEDS